MNKSLSVLLFVFLFILSGCEKPTEVVNKCKDVVCQNSGTCTDGVCDCPKGYNGDHCETILPGAVGGTVHPHELFTSVVLTAIRTGDSYQVSIGPYGNFWFTEVKPGSYILHVNTISPYWVSRPDTTVIVSAGDTTDGGYFTTTRNTAAQGIVSFSIDGGPNHILNDDDFYGSYYSHVLGIHGSEAGGVNDPLYSMDLSVGGITGPGNYIIHQGSHLDIYHSNPDGHCKAGNGYSDATLNISSLDTITKKFSGTFSGTLSPVNTFDDSIHITGSFTDIYW